MRQRHGTQCSQRLRSIRSCRSLPFGTCAVMTDPARTRGIQTAYAGVQVAASGARPSLGARNPGHAEFAMNADGTCIRNDVHVLDIGAHVRALRYLSTRGYSVLK